MTTTPLKKGDKVSVIEVFIPVFSKTEPFYSHILTATVLNVGEEIETYDIMVDRGQGASGCEGGVFESITIGSLYSSTCDEDALINAFVLPGDEEPMLLKAAEAVDEYMKQFSLAKDAIAAHIKKVREA